MRIAVIGTGGVGRALAERLAGLGHEVVIGTRDVEATLARAEPDPFLGTPPFGQWQSAHPEVTLRSFADAGAFGELVINATSGVNSLAALNQVGADNLAGKVLLDLALPLDLSQGMPPTLTVANTDSLGEQIQRTFPEARVVKTLNSVSYAVMVDPGRVPGEHNLFIAGDADDAKAAARDLLAAFGWPDGSVLDLGDITGARASEMYSRLLFQLAGVLGTFDVNIAVRHADIPGN